MNERTEAEGALAAMTRAAEAARVRATRFGSRLAIWKDGAVVLVSPQTNGAEQGGADQPATAPELNPEGDSKPESESEGRFQ